MWPAVPRVSGCIARTVSYRALDDTPTRRATRDRGARRPRARLAAAGRRVGRGGGVGDRLQGLVGTREARRAGGDGADRADRLGRADRGADGLAAVADPPRVADVRRRVQRALPVAAP